MSAQTFHVAGVHATVAAVNPRSGTRAWNNGTASAIERAAAGVLLLVLVAACGPIPGGSLSGRAAPAPADWASVIPDQHTFCEIESRPADPHSIQLDCFLHDGSLYVQSHRWALASWWPVRSWAAIWIEHPDVRVRIDDAIYELRAVRVREAPERQSVLKFRGYDPVPAGVVLFRFAPRT